MQNKRDPRTSAVLSTDAQAFNKYKREREYYRKVTQMESDISEIKTCLESICQRMDKLESR